jgi:undecaprenyl diphosphate synthase
MLDSFAEIIEEKTEEYELLNNIDISRIPDHIAVIMDGNGRWAKSKGLERVEGHRAGTESARKITEYCARLGVKYLTLFTFSSENWKRPKKEVNTLMKMLHDNLLKQSDLLIKNNIKLSLIGNMEKLPGFLKKKLEETIKMSENFTGLNLILAINYGSRAEILYAIKEIIKETKDYKKIDEKLFKSYLYTSDIPDPDLLIRTSGEIRISNFLLYQLAYTELYFTETLWPDFRMKELFYALIDFQKRERRYGKI